MLGVEPRRAVHGRCLANRPNCHSGTLPKIARTGDFNPFKVDGVTLGKSRTGVRRATAEGPYYCLAQYGARRRSRTGCLSLTGRPHIHMCLTGKTRKARESNSKVRRPTVFETGTRANGRLSRRWPTL